MRIIYTIIIFLLLATTGYSQNERLYTLFVFNKLQYNPAYAGANEVLNMGVHYRHQWQGVNGAPRTISAFAHTPFGENRNGIGLSLVSDEIGMLNTVMGKIDYAYRIHLKNGQKLSVGLSALVDNSRFDWTRANSLDIIDNTVPLDASAQTTLNVGVGAYYSGNNFYLGLSTPTIMRNSITSNAYQGFRRYNGFRPYYLMGGLMLPVGDNVHIRPSLLVSYVKNAPFEADFNLSLLFMEKFWIGTNYRLRESIDVFAQFPVTKRIKLAVGYDYPVTKLNQFTSGSGEIMIEYLFVKGKDRINNIRFF